ncbi:N4-gp56 family major capsid protein [Crocinitomicaceae bacterium]|nr:N4-gp56 family major capsid protein [Crocinitomicaceae bacterium]
MSYTVVDGVRQDAAAPQAYDSTNPTSTTGDPKWAQYVDQDTKTSSVGPQLTLHHMIRKALIEQAKNQLFTQMASTINLPKNSGKKIVRNVYRRVISDFNANDQGLDAAGAVIPLVKATADDKQVAYEAMHGKLSRLTDETDVEYRTRLATFMAKAADATSGNSGNLWGSAKALATVQARLPKIGENGGRKNRIGITRVTLESTLENYGMFLEYTRDALDFDTDPQLEMHYTREAVRAANEVYEATVQSDLISSAGVHMYANGSTSLADMSNQNTVGNVSEPTYMDFMRLGIILDQNECPKDTQIISGATANDTMVVGAARFAYIDATILLHLRQLADSFGGKAFIPVEHYAKAGNIAEGEVGAIGPIRFIVHPEMMHKAGVGGDTTAAADPTEPASGYYSTDGNFDVYPIMVVGNDSFNTIGFKSGRNSGSSRLEIIHKRPGAETADRNDPFGKTGFMSIQWWYGSLITHPEWIACLWTLARI